MAEESNSNSAWIFPDIKTVISDNSEREFTPNQYDEVGRDYSNDDNDITKRLKEENAQLLSEIEMLKSKISEIDSLVESIVAKLVMSSSYIDDELVDTIKFFIKSICEKIVRKEIGDNDETLIGLISQLKEHFDKQLGPISIYVCEKDFQRINKIGSPLFGVLKVDKMIDVGDVIIQSNCSEVRALVAESIDKMLR